MAPSLEEPIIQQEDLIKKFPVKDLPVRGKLEYVPGRAPVKIPQEPYQHDWARPIFPDVKWPPLELHEYVDRGLSGDAQFKNLLSDATDVFDYNPKIGTEIHGIRLSQLTDAQKDDLARLVAIRGVVFFRNQYDFDIDSQRELMSHFGKLHAHATTMTPQTPGYDDVHVIYTKEDSKDARAIFTPTFLWHSDVTYELQPLSYTCLKVLSGPPRGAGGDTLWSSQYAAYDALSPFMQKYLENLTALHSAQMQADGARALGRTVRRDPVITEHPLIRTHPVTGWKALFFNPGFVTKIVGIPKTESEHLMRYLNEVVATTQELHARFQWGENDVALWDNRICNHSATYGFNGHRRHAVRVGVQGERPILNGGRSQEEEYCELYGLPKVNKDGSGIENYND